MHINISPLHLSPVPTGRAAAESELVRPETNTQRQTGKRRRRKVNKSNYCEMHVIHNLKFL